PAAAARFCRALTPRQRWASRHLTPCELLQTGADLDDRRRLRLALLMDRWRDVIALLAPHALPPQDYARALCPEPWRRVPGFAQVWHLGRVTWRLIQRLVC